MRYLPSDLAKLFGITTNTVRRYEQSSFLKPKRDSSGYRWYEDFDLSKTALIRLYIKCGLSHDEIRAMLNKDSDEIISICQNKLEEMDKEMERLKRLRHWLKDNIQLIKNADDLIDNFYFMDCPAVYYVISSIGDEILTDKKRLETVNYFLYQAPEIHIFQLFKRKDLDRKKIIPYTGWSVRENDLAKYHMEEFVKTNDFVEYYPKKKCIYSTIALPAEDVYNKEKQNYARMKFYDKALKFINDNGYKTYGDNMELIANGLGNQVTILTCIPIKKIEE